MANTNKIALHCEICKEQKHYVISIIDPQTATVITKSVQDILQVSGNMHYDMLKKKQVDILLSKNQALQSG